MKEYQDWIDKIVIAAAVIISGLLIARSLSIGFLQLNDIIFIK